MPVALGILSFYNQVILFWLCTIYVLILTGILLISEEEPISNFCIILAYTSLHVPQDKKNELVIFVIIVLPGCKKKQCFGWPFG